MLKHAPGSELHQKRPQTQAPSALRGRRWDTILFVNTTRYSSKQIYITSRLYMLLFLLECK
jgi:hypothetical protein